MSTITTEREQFLADVICTAIEGGIGYWSVTYAYKWQDLPPAEVWAAIVPCDEYDQNPPVTDGDLAKLLEEHGRKITVQLIEDGIKAIYDPAFRLNATIFDSIRRADATNDAGMIDADGADAIVQAAIFGELVYG